MLLYSPKLLSFNQKASLLLEETLLEETSPASISKV